MHHFDITRPFPTPKERLEEKRMNDWQEVMAFDEVTDAFYFMRMSEHRRWQSKGIVPPVIVEARKKIAAENDIKNQNLNWYWIKKQILGG